MTDMPTLTKQQCRDMAPDGWDYGGYWDGLYRYHTGGHPGSYDYKNNRKHTGFMNMACTLEDMEPHNLQRMAELGVTR